MIQATQSTMKAIAFERFGGVETMIPQTLPVPVVRSQPLPPKSLGFRGSRSVNIGHMRELELVLGLFVAGVILAAAARRVGAPYPVFLAIGGALLAFLPGAPSFGAPLSLRWRCSSHPCCSMRLTMRRSEISGTIGRQ
jgi:hypothetical protein